jgi:diacylglycerol kinase (ATP)
MKKVSPQNDRIRAFRHAFNGFFFAVQKEVALQIHVLATVLVLILGGLLGCTATECIALVLCIALVWVAELLNTAIELLCNRITTDQDMQIKHVKDVSAAAVLIAVVFALVVGGIIFIPKLHVL